MTAEDPTNAAPAVPAPAILRKSRLVNVRLNPYRLPVHLASPDTLVYDGLVDIIGMRYPQPI